MQRAAFILTLAFLPLTGFPVDLPYLLDNQKILAPYAYQGGPVPVAFLDADGTVRVSKGIGFAPHSPSDVMSLPGVPEKVAELNRQGYFVAIFSNQSSTIQRRHIPSSMVDAAMQETVRQLESPNGRIHYYDFSSLDLDSKPNTLMADRLEAHLQRTYGPQAKIDRARSFMVGDAAYLRPGNGYP